MMFRMQTNQTLLMKTLDGIDWGIVAVACEDILKSSACKKALIDLIIDAVSTPDDSISSTAQTRLLAWTTLYAQEST